VQALLFDLPRHSIVAAGAEPDRGGGHHDPWTVRVRANLVNVAVDVDGGLPRCTAIRRPRDTAHVYVGEEHGAVRGGGHRTYPKRRSDALTVDECRARVPCLAPGNRIEAVEFLGVSVRADAQHACIVGPDVDHVADRHATGEIHLRDRDCAPHAVGSAPAKGTSCDDGESAAMPVGRERSDGLRAELLVAGLAGDDEQPVAPGGHKHRWRRHDGRLSARRALQIVEGMCGISPKRVAGGRSISRMRIPQRGRPAQPRTATTVSLTRTHGHRDTTPGAIVPGLQHAGGRVVGPSVSRAGRRSAASC
jgi:hypothetical protein